MIKIELLKTNRIVDMVVLHIITITALILYLPSTALLYPMGYYFGVALEIFFVSSLVGLFLIYKKPKIARVLFLTTVAGTFLTILTYVLMKGVEHASFFTFIFVVLSSSLLLLLVPVWFLGKK